MQNNAREGTVRRFPTQKAAALIGYLALTLPRPTPREILIDLFWPDAAPAQARNSLSAALSAIRPLLEPIGLAAHGDILIADRHQIGLNTDRVTTDVAQFDRLLDTADRTTELAERCRLREQALLLYTGPCLPGYYDPWAIQEQDRLRERHALTLRTLTTDYQERGDASTALRFALRAVDADPFVEQAQQVLLRLLVTAGRISQAKEAYGRMERLFREELGIVPAEETRRLLNFSNHSHTLASPATDTNENPSSVMTLPDDESPGGAVPLGSQFYITRPTDAAFHAALRRRDSIVLVKGVRMVGKTSLLARGLQQARQGGMSVALTDFSVLGTAERQDADRLFRSLAVMLADQLRLDVDPLAQWSSARSPSMNLERFLTLEALDTDADAPHLIWGLDELDRLFTVPFGTDVFALFRSWHNRRSLDPGGPWGKITLAITYATEAHLFLTDLNQSPFNVGTRLTLEDFGDNELHELNRHYGEPLADTEAFAAFRRLIGGHPYLARVGLRALAVDRKSLDHLINSSRDEEGIFGEHLRRLRLALSRDSRLEGVVAGMLHGEPCPTSEDMYRLRAAGLIKGEHPGEATFRCQLYEEYLRQHLR